MWEVYKFCKGIGCDVTSFSSHTSEAKRQKFGIHNPHMDGSKVIYYIFDILRRSLVI